MSWGKCLMVVTGASRGFGATIVTSLVQHFAPGSVVLIISRSKDGMETLRPQLEARGIQLMCVAMDLTSPDCDVLRSAVASCHALLGPTCSRAVMIHNAGSLGTMHYSPRLEDFSHVAQYYNFNISSIYPLNAAFLATVNKIRSTQPNLKVQVVNVSSIAAIQPMKSLSLYCAGKAARDMLFEVLALEEPTVAVLNYAPGPLDTDMHKLIRDECGDAELQKTFVECKESKQLLTCEQSVAKLVTLLDGEDFTSGKHIDYFDIPDKK